MSTQEWLIVFGISLGVGVAVLAVFFLLFSKGNPTLKLSTAVAVGLGLFAVEIGLNALYARYGRVGLPSFAGLAGVMLLTGAVGAILLWKRLEISPALSLVIMLAFVAAKAVCAVQLSAQVSPKTGVYGPKLISAWSEPPAWEERPVDNILLSLPGAPLSRKVEEPPNFKGMEVETYLQAVDYGDYAIEIFTLRSDTVFNLDEGAHGLLRFWKRAPGVSEFLEKATPVTVGELPGRQLEGTYREGALSRHYRALLLAGGTDAWAVRVTGAEGPATRVAERVLPSVTVPNAAALLAESQSPAKGGPGSSASALAAKGTSATKAGAPLSKPATSPLTPRTKSGKPKGLTLESSTGLDLSDGMKKSKKELTAERKAALAAYPVARELHTQDGRSLQVSILGRSGGSVRFVGSNGQEHSYPITNLAPADRDFVRSLPVTD